MNTLLSTLEDENNLSIPSSFSLNNMAASFKLIPQISPTEKNWQAKVIVAEKFLPKQARHSSSRYQNMILMDLQGNIVHTTLYDSNITAFEDQLQLSKTYVISNALVKDTKPEYRASNGNVQWIISGKTRVEEVNENHMEFLFSTYSFTHFPELEKHMDSNSDISILAVAIDIRPKRLIQTRFGNQTYVQDIFLIDRTFHTIILTMWDGFVEKECVVIAENIAKKPIILANRLKVSSFNGLTLSTKINSTFFIDAGFNEVAEIRKWVEAHKEELNDIALEKPNQIVTPTKLSPTSQKNFTEIEHLKGRLLGRKYYWIKAKPSIKTTKQTFWYMSCNNCNKVTHADFHETFMCIYCKHPTAKAVPRANVTIQLEDGSGTLDASAIGEPAEMILKHSAEDLMNFTKAQQTDPSSAAISLRNTEAEYIFYVKVSQLEQNTTQYRYEIIFVLNALPTITDAMEHQTAAEKNKSSLNFAQEKNSDSEETSAPSAKRVLFGTSTKLVNPMIPDMPTEKRNASPSSATHQVTTKRKLD